MIVFYDFLLKCIKKLIFHSKSLFFKKICILCEIYAFIEKYRKK